uniref:aECM cysteine-cradle domain-containing protein n=1 Tax=Steinernema glaseri TaxID=37863 RepID=A0A1I7ZIS9_9BILA
MSFSIDESPDDEALKPGMSFSIDMNPNLEKSDVASLTTKEKSLSPLEILKERRLTEMAIVERQRQLELERREREEHERRLHEERERLEQARLLRAEQERLEEAEHARRVQEQKAEQERRRERIQQQLAELAAAERRQRELIERRERLLREQRLRASSTAAPSPSPPDYPNFEEEDSRPPQVRFHHAFVEPRLPESTDATVIQTTTTPAAEEFRVPDEQCRSIRRFLRIYKITDPGRWIMENCIFAKQYFPQASCAQIQQFFESCF